MTTAMREKAAPFNYTEMVKDKITGFGADLVGVADVEPMKEYRVDPQSMPFWTGNTCQRNG